MTVDLPQYPITITTNINVNVPKHKIKLVVIDGKIWNVTLPTSEESLITAHKVYGL